MAPANANKMRIPETHVQSRARAATSAAARLRGDGCKARRRWTEDTYALLGNLLTRS